MTIKESAVIGRDSISIETGNWAKQADGSVVYRSGNLVLLATVCATDDAKEGQDFFPLTCEYQEKLYSVGRIPGGYIKRESKPSEHEVLLSRIIDRPIRPLFPEGYFCEVQLIVQVLSSDKNTTIQGHALNAASAALSVSNIPFSGPIGGVRVGRVNGELIANPTIEELVNSDMDIVVAGLADSVVMIEGEAKELSNSELLDALKFAHQYIKEHINLQNALVKSAKVVKKEVKLRTRDEKLYKAVRDFSFDKMSAANKNTDKLKRSGEINQLVSATVEHFKSIPEFEGQSKEIKNFLHEIESEIVRDLIFKESIRADGRKLNEIRSISCELDVLPGAHGSAVFTRGQTQSLGVMTLGTVADGQRYENLQGQKEKVFMLHYNFPAFSVGEVKRSSGPGRREVGHGNLAERALRNVLPDFNTFPYVIRLVSEILESNGSSSMASVCSGSLAMMTGGVPIRAAVAGVAMGLITSKDKQFAILSDIAGLEDHFGDMDFKLAGTRKGVTAFQMDLKVVGVGIDVLEKVFKQAEEGRNHILDEMEKSISKSAADLSVTAPRITIKMIPKDRIGELIGPGGKNIRSIIEQSKADINIDDDGKVTVSSPDFESSKKAIDLIEGMFAEIEVGKIYEGTIKRIADFGAFVEILPGKEGLCHISKIDNKRVNSVRDIVKEGDKVRVKVIGVDRQGKIDLSRKDAMNDQE
ncbi:MAG: polyribonucleotide nucleotidyltransferase [Leptospira sp.]|nr:polyribonucleotide nucleotidyltransferase [Leptospira sp.]